MYGVGSRLTSEAGRERTSTGSQDGGRNGRQGNRRGLVFRSFRIRGLWPATYALSHA
ncbi:hypothetical protein BGLT_07483 [Caballeronia glathei]|nr:hypothetical protein BGLT_07483 [Caballeronia glathei]